VKTLEAFETAESDLLTVRIEKAAKYKIVSEYDAEKKTIKFLDTDCPVNGKLINEFIQLVPKFWADKRHWDIMLKHVKCAASLANDFEPKYFLHKWSAKNKELYNEAGNNNRYERCRVDPATAGESLTWLRNRATSGYMPDSNLSRGDMGFAEMFATSAGESIKIAGNGDCYSWDDSSRLWVPRSNKWIGNEVSWKLEHIINRRMKLLRAITSVDVAGELKQCGQKKEKVLSYRGAMDVVNKVTPMLEDAEFITRINLQPDLLPIRDGLVVDLRTGESSKRQPGHYFTFECPVKLDRNPEKHQLVEKFMLDICCGDADLLRYMQISLGYCITGRINEKAVFVWWGDLGDNGKSTLMNIMKAVLGNYCKSASKSVFIKSKSDSKLTPEREVLKDTRMVVFSETSANDILNDEVLKMASGDDVIKVNPKFEKEYEFRSYAKLLIASNNKPKIDVSDTAMVKRVKLIPFLTRFVTKPSAPHERFRDVPLAARMESDLLDAFFTWLLDGAKQWYVKGLVDVPAVMQKEKAVYLQENDEVGEFLIDETEPDAIAFIQSSLLYKKYCDWCKARNSASKGLKTFSQDMERKHKKERKKIGQVFIGLRLKTREDEGILALDI
jgi:P4 family phage/plasmid primase-like protien